MTLFYFSNYESAALELSKTFQCIKIYNPIPNNISKKIFLKLLSEPCVIVYKIYKIVKQWSEISSSASLKLNDIDHDFRTELNLERLVYCYTQSDSCMAFVSTCYEHTLENLTFPAKRYLYIE